MAAVKTKTHEQPLPTTLETLSTDSSWHHAVEASKNLPNMAPFLEFIEKRSLNSANLDSPEYTEALAMYADLHKNDFGDMYSAPAAAQLHLLGRTPQAINNMLLLNEFQQRRKQGEYFSPEDWNAVNQLKKEAVKYNQMISGYMYKYSDDTYSDIHFSLFGSALMHTPKERLAQAENLFNNTITGARMEAAAQHLMDSVSHVTGISYRPASIQEDLRGADLVVKYKGHEYPIDIKASFDQLAGADRGYEFREKGQWYCIFTHAKTGKKRILLYPGFKDTFLGDKLRLTDEETAELTMPLAVQLDRAIREMA